MGAATSVAFDAGGQRVVSAGEDGRVLIWAISSDTGVPELLQAMPVSSEAVMWAAISPDGQRIACVGRDPFVHILDAGSGDDVVRLIGHESTIYRVAFSPDSGQVVTVSGDATVRFWDLSSGANLFTVRLPTNAGWPVPLWDFDCRWVGADCWIAVPLTRGKLALYYLEGVYA